MWRQSKEYARFFSQSMWSSVGVTVDVYSACFRTCSASPRVGKRERIEASVVLGTRKVSRGWLTSVFVLIPRCAVLRPVILLYFCYLP